MRRAINITVDEMVLFELNRRRPLIPRSAYIEHLLRVDLGLEELIGKCQMAELEP